jgi:plastocyanin
MRKPLIICIVLVAAGALTAGLALAAIPAPNPIKVGDNWFVKDTDTVLTRTVKRNTTVKFKIVEGVHDIWGYPSSNKEIDRNDSPFLKNQTATQKVTKTGTFRIYCQIHGKDVQSMKLKVINP